MDNLYKWLEKYFFHVKVKFVFPEIIFGFPSKQKKYFHFHGFIVHWIIQRSKGWTFRIKGFAYFILFQEIYDWNWHFFSRWNLTLMLLHFKLFEMVKMFWSMTWWHVSYFYIPLKYCSYCQSQARLKPKRCLDGFIFTLNNK